MNMNFYKDKKILITGHNGFKGSWLCQILLLAGANVTGYSLENPPTNPNLFSILKLKNKINSISGDIRDLERLQKTFDKVKPEIVFHLAAQPIVRTSYDNPVYTYETNVIGTVNVLECIRKCDSVKSFVNVTTDKVYKNNEWEWGYRENDPLDGFDPYSNSKSCSELITHTYKRSFFQNREIAISTARAGNVIGGGDFAKDRIIPDCIRAANKNEKIIVRNPNSIRPYQHVLEPLFAYLTIAEMQYENKNYSDSYNIGPKEEDCLTTGKIVKLFCEKWKNGLSWENINDGGPHESNFLKLDCSKIKQKLDWKQTWNIEKAIEKIIEFEKNENKVECVNSQIKEFIKNKGD